MICQYISASELLRLNPDPNHYVVFLGVMSEAILQQQGL